MDPTQELLNTNGWDAWLQYMQTHSLSTILIAVSVLLAPFILRFLLGVIWKLIILLGTFVFKDQFRTLLRSKICSLLHRYVDERLDIYDTPVFDTNMVTLYSVGWQGEGIGKLRVNRAEIRVDLGETIRKYLKLWLKSFFVTFDYRNAQKQLLSNCVKDVRLYRPDLELYAPAPEQGKIAAVAALPGKQGQDVNPAAHGLEQLRLYNLNIAFERGDVLLHIAGEEFRLQNLFGTFENTPQQSGDSSCCLRAGCIYDGENISITSLDDRMQSFAIALSSVNFDGKLWKVISAYNGYIPETLQMKDGKFLDIRIVVRLQEGRLRFQQCACKIDEGKFAYNALKVDDLEASLFTEDLQEFRVKRLSMKLNNRYLEVKGGVDLRSSQTGDYNFTVVFAETSWSLNHNVNVNLLGGFKLKGQVHYDKERIDLALQNKDGSLRLDLPRFRSQSIFNIAGVFSLQKGVLSCNAVNLQIGHAPVRVEEGSLNFKDWSFALRLAAADVPTDQLRAGEERFEGKVDAKAYFCGDLDDRKFQVAGEYCIHDMQCSLPLLHFELPRESVVQGKVGYKDGFCLQDSRLKTLNMDVPVYTYVEDGRIRLDFTNALADKARESFGIGQALDKAKNSVGKFLGR